MHRSAESLSERGLLAVHLLRNVEKYLKASNIAPTRFGRDVVGDPRFVFDLRNGREPRPKTVARVMHYLEATR